MTFLDFIEKDVLKKCEESVRIYIDENKHRKHFENAYESFEPSEEIRVIVDDSIRANGKTGFIFTDKAIYTHDSFLFSSDRVYRDDVTEIESLDYTYRPNRQIFELMINGKFAKQVTLCEFDFECIKYLISSYSEYLKVLSDERKKIEQEKAKQEQIRQEKIEREKAEREKAEREKAERERAEREKIELEKRTVSTEDGRKVTRESILKIHESDAIYEHIYRTRDTLTSTLFSSWNASDRDRLAMAVKRYFSHNIIYIRDSSIDKYNVYQLKNDIATAHINLFLMLFLYNELQARGLNKEQIFFVLMEGMSVLFPSSEEAEMCMQLFVATLDGYISHSSSYSIALDDMLYINLLYSNITENFIVPMTDGVIEYYSMCSDLINNGAIVLQDIMDHNMEKFNFRHRQEIKKRSAIEFSNIARILFGVELIDNHRMNMMKRTIDDIVKELRTLRIDFR